MLSVGNEILSCRSFKDLERGILAPMTAYLDAETGCFLQITYDANAATQIGKNNCYNLSHSSHMDYVDHYFHEDPAIDVCRLPTREQIGVYSTSDYCDYTQFTKGILYNEFFRPNHMHHVLVMIMRADWRSSGWLALGFQRPPGSSAFGVVLKSPRPAHCRHGGQRDPMSAAAGGARHPRSGGRSTRDGTPRDRRRLSRLTPDVDLRQRKGTQGSGPRRRRPFGQ